MTTETSITSEQLIEPSLSVSPPSLMKTLLWLVIILFLPQIVLAFGFGIFFGIQQGSDFTEEAFNIWFASIPVMLTLSLISPLFTIPLMNKATDADGWASCFNFWALKTVHTKVLLKWLFIGLAFWLLSTVIGEWLKLPVEQFMLDVKTASDSAVVLVLMLVTICLVIPVMEELVFRGWLFSRIAQTKLGDIGALVLTAMIFVAIHSQYEQAITFFSIFALGLLLAFTRYKTNNISYSIAIHILFNSLATITLFFFL